ncbi:hypothetical protein OC844_003198 [Tilletia horrida]|nr:hypothetical protein OC844_003198 [Tilletia horrida]
MTPSRTGRRRSRRNATPYHVGLVAFLSLLAAGLPLASLFKVYTFVLCVAFPPAAADEHDGQHDDDDAAQPLSLHLPPAPSLPFPSPTCPTDPRIASATSSYAATVTALASILALTSLDSASALTRRFGRKPLMLLMHCLLILGYTTVRFGVAIAQAASNNRRNGIAALVLVMIGAVLAETAQGAPLRIALQNYIVDTVPHDDDDDDQDADEDGNEHEHPDDDDQEEEQEEHHHHSPLSPGNSRASALSFLDGIGQLGAFPSSTLGGLLAALTSAFFAPFYAAIVVVGLAFAWALLGVPESKTDRQHIAIIDELDPSSSSSPAQQGAGERRRQAGSSSGSRHADVDDDANQEPAPHPQQQRSLLTRLRHRLAFLNFLKPLAIFRPVRSPSTNHLDLRLPILALLILAEETYQAFLLPAFLLFCSDVFGYNQLEEGYLVSILQGTRALWLALVFPRLLGWARNAVSRRAERRVERQSQTQGSDDERTPLLHRSNGNHNEDQEQKHRIEREQTRARARLDVIILLLSYALSILAFLLIAASRSYARDAESNRLELDVQGKGKGADSAWWVLIAGIVLLQLASGSASVRTALIVNAASSPAARRHLPPRSSSSEEGQDGQAEQEEEAEAEGAEETSASTAESLALAANQILITFTTALMPLLTSLVYSRGLQAQPRARPELVWIFKAGVAGLSAIVCAALAWEGERVRRRESREEREGHGQQRG